MKTELYVIGWPIAHSKSPLLHNTMLESLGLADQYRYTVRPVPPDGLPQFLDQVRRENCGGFNATMPFKRELLPHLDHIDPLAAKLGAVNTVVVREGELWGCNTDCPGYLAALQQAGFDPRRKNVLLLGAGGAAAAVALAMAEGGARHVVVCNRTLSHAGALAALAPGVIFAHPWTQEDLPYLAAASDLLINATSLGMEGQEPWPYLDFLEALPPHAWVSDLIYHPAQTPLLLRAAQLGHPVQNGLPLLVHQAILALERFLDRPIPPETVLPALEQALNNVKEE